MILYDKSGMFLGMGAQELSLLGYDDMEEFRNYHNDIADLFINKPGYIFKFKNFSWIDYTLHSGTPNRRVLIKTKNEREVDSALHIHEIFLTQELYGAKACFGVEFVSANPFTKIETPLVVSTPLEDTPEPVETSHPKESPSFVMEDAPAFEAPFEEELPTFDMPYTSENTFELHNLSKTGASVSEIGDFKLKFDSEILNEPSLVIKPSLVEHEDLLKDNLLFAEEPLPTLTKEQEVSIETKEVLFDFSLSAEALGLDISTLAEIITEYVEELGSKMPLITRAVASQQSSYAREEIVKLKSVALHLRIIPLYNQFEYLEEQLDSHAQDATMPLLLRVQNVISDLKDSL